MPTEEDLTWIHRHEQAMNDNEHHVRGDKVLLYLILMACCEMQ